MEQLETNKCSEDFSYRQKGKMGTNRPVPMARVKSLPTKLYSL